MAARPVSWAAWRRCKTQRTGRTLPLSGCWRCGGASSSVRRCASVFCACCWRTHDHSAHAMSPCNKPCENSTGSCPRADATMLTITTMRSASSAVCAALPDSCASTLSLSCRACVHETGRRCGQQEHRVAAAGLATCDEEPRCLLALGLTIQQSSWQSVPIVPAPGDTSSRACRWMLGTATQATRQQGVRSIARGQCVHVCMHAVACCCTGSPQTTARPC